MTPCIYWFMPAFGMLALKMAIGTFYMLMLAVALAIGGVAALLGLDLPVQITTALAGITGTVILRRMKSTRPTDAASQSRHWPTGAAYRLARGWGGTGALPWCRTGICRHGLNGGCSDEYREGAK